MRNLNGTIRNNNFDRVIVKKKLVLIFNYNKPMKTLKSNNISL